MRVDQALSEARACGVDRLDAQLLLGHSLRQSRAWLMAHGEHELDPEQVRCLRAQWVRRAAGEPLAYLLGEQEFCGLRLQVTPDVLVPRPETEMLVDWAQQALLSAPQATVLDLGTGSGAIALAIKHRHAQARLTGSDASDAALAVARANGLRLGLDVEWLRGDWWAPMGARKFGLAVANPPYVAGDDPHLAALGHEPRSALTPGGDGLSALRQIVADAPAHLLQGAQLLLEHGHDQGAAVREMLNSRGFEDVQTRHDLADLPRCTGGIWPVAT
jgi:release factor glutamine methyltransferase